MLTPQDVTLGCFSAQLPREEAVARERGGELSSECQLDGGHEANGEGDAAASTPPTNLLIQEVELGQHPAGGLAGVGLERLFLGER